MDGPLPLHISAEKVLLEISDQRNILSRKIPYSKNCKMQKWSDKMYCPRSDNRSAKGQILLIFVKMIFKTITTSGQKWGYQNNEEKQRFSKCRGSFSPRLPDLDYTRLNLNDQD